MGSGGSSELKGKTVLTGTFLAEQTHKSSTSYTLVSQRAASDSHSSACVGNIGGNRGDRLRKASARRGGTQCIKLAALDDLESLLLPELAPVLPGATSQVLPSLESKNIASHGPLSLISKTDDASDLSAAVRQCVTEERRGLDNPVPAPGHQDGCEDVQFSPPPCCEQALLPGVPVEMPPEMLKRSPGQLQKACKKPFKGRPPVPSPAISPSRRPHSRQVSQEARSPIVEKSIAAKRLYITKKPWESEASDRQLLQYLAARSGSKEIASVRRSTDQTGTPRCHRRQHRNHRDLFNDCLFREGSPLPTTHEECRLQEREQRFVPSNTSVSGSVSRSTHPHGQGGSLLDQIEEIMVIPQDAVSAFFETASDCDLCPRRHEDDCEVKSRSVNSSLTNNVLTHQTPFCNT